MRESTLSLSLSNVPLYVCEKVCGKGASVTWDQRAQLPYTMAVMKEIQRYADIAPTGLMHKVPVFSGYRPMIYPHNL